MTALDPKRTLEKNSVQLAVRERLVCHSSAPCTELRVLAQLKAYHD